MWTMLLTLPLIITTIIMIIKIVIKIVIKIKTYKLVIRVPFHSNFSEIQVCKKMKKKLFFLIIHFLKKKLQEHFIF